MIQQLTYDSQERVECQKHNKMKTSNYIMEEDDHARATKKVID